MFCRPLVAATVMGLLLDDVPAGLSVGMVLELFYLGAATSGAALPENDTLAATGTAAAAASHGARRRAAAAPRPSGRSPSCSSSGWGARGGGWTGGSSATRRGSPGWRWPPRRRATSGARCGRTSGGCGRTSSSSALSPPPARWRASSLGPLPGAAAAGPAARARLGLSRRWPRWRRRSRRAAAMPGARRCRGPAARSLVTAGRRARRAGEERAVSAPRPRLSRTVLLARLPALALPAGLVEPQGHAEPGARLRAVPGAASSSTRTRRRRGGGAPPPRLLQHPPLRGGGHRRRGALPRAAHRPGRGDARSRWWPSRPR